MIDQHILGVYTFGTLPPSHTQNNSVLKLIAFNRNKLQDYNEQICGYYITGQLFRKHKSLPVYFPHVCLSYCPVGIQCTVWLRVPIKQERICLCKQLSSEECLSLCLWGGKGKELRQVYGVSIGFPVLLDQTIWWNIGGFASFFWCWVNIYWLRGGWCRVVWGLTK